MTITIEVSKIHTLVLYSYYVGRRGPERQPLWALAALAGTIDLQWILLSVKKHRPAQCTRK